MWKVAVPLITVLLSIGLIVALCVALIPRGSSENSNIVKFPAQSTTTTHKPTVQILKKRIQDRISAKEPVRNGPCPALPIGNIKNPLPNSPTTFNMCAEFVGIAGLKKALRHAPSAHYGDLTRFRELSKNRQWSSIHNLHFDWWMFPVSTNTLSMGWKYSVFGGDILLLKKDSQYIADYLEGVEIVCRAWGWDLGVAQPVTKPDADQCWTGYKVRLEKIRLSLKLFAQFGQDMGIARVRDSVEAFVHHIK